MEWYGKDLWLDINPKQGVTVVESTPHKCICRHKSSITSQVLSNLSKIPHLDETKFTYTFNMFGEGKV